MNILLQLSKMSRTSQLSFLVLAFILCSTTLFIFFNTTNAQSPKHLPTSHGSTPLPNSHSTIQPLSSAWEGQPSPVMIVQHFHLHEEMQMRSMRNHHKYAEAHGYPYFADNTSYVPLERTWKQKSVNKLYSQLRVMLNELAKGKDRVEWILSVSSA